MNLGAVILTYNDSDRALKQIERLSSYGVFDRIVVVDNCSDDINKNKLLNIKNDKIKVIFNNKNIGYGAGNNVGIKILENIGIQYVLLVNNDIVIKKQTIIDCFNFIRNNNKCSAVTSQMIENGKLKRNYYDIPTLKNTLNFVQSTFGKYSKSMKKYDGYLTSDFVRESATIYSIKALKDVNYFDENIFMFEEGSSTGYLFKQKGYFEAVLTNTEPYVHNHKGPLINRKLFAINKKSRIYFFKKYLHYGWFKILIFRIYWLNIFIK